MNPPGPRLILAAALITASLACAGPGAERPAQSGGAATEDLVVNPRATDSQKELIALKLFRQAQATIAEGDAVGAVKLYRQSLKLYEDIGDTAAQAAIHNDLGLLLQRAGQFDKADAILAQAVVLARDSGEARVLAEAQLNLGRLQYERGQNDAAEMSLSDALKTEAQVDDKTLKAMALNARGNVRRRHGEHAAAIEDYTASVETWTSLSEDAFAAVAMMNIGYSQALLNQDDKAAQSFQRAIELFGDSPSAQRDLMVPHLERLIRLIKTQPDEARKQIGEALTAP